MSRKLFTDKQLEELKQNPNVAFADYNRITYAEDFRKRFVREYAQGKTPARIFEEAGFDIKALGKKRIERASARWRKSSNLGTMETGAGYVDVHRDRRRTGTSEENILTRVQELEAEVDSLKRIIREMRED